MTTINTSLFLFAKCTIHSARHVFIYFLLTSRIVPSADSPFARVNFPSITTSLNLLSRILKNMKQLEVSLEEVKLVRRTFKKTVFSFNMMREEITLGVSIGDLWTTSIPITALRMMRMEKCIKIKSGIGFVYPLTLYSRSLLSLVTSVFLCFNLNPSVWM